MSRDNPWNTKLIFVRMPRILSKSLHYLHGLLLLEIVRALKLTGRNLFRNKVTVQYPEEKTPQSPRFKGLHALRRYPSGEERCIACKLCEAVCPACCIYIDSQTRDDGTRRTKRYDIDLFKCIYCGFCEEACPTDAIVLTRIFEFSFDRRGPHIINKERLHRIGDEREQEIRRDREMDRLYR